MAITFTQKDEDLDDAYLSSAQQASSDGDDDSVLYQTQEAPSQPYNLAPVEPPAASQSAYSPELAPAYTTPAAEATYVDATEGEGDYYQDYEASQYPTTYQDQSTYTQQGDTYPSNEAGRYEYDTPATVPPAPAQVAAPTGPSRKDIKKYDQQVEYTYRIIRMLDAYRGIGLDEKRAVGTVIYDNGDFSMDTETAEADLIVSILNADDMVGITLKNLRDAAEEKDRVARVFMILELPDTQLAALGEMAARFVPEGVTYQYNARDRIRYSREVEQAIEMIPDVQVSDMSAVESVINA
jgi:hypothetical protein